jgi:hypothetical protein
MKSILLTLSVSLYLATCIAAPAQPTPSSAEPHTVNGITSAATFPGSDIGAKVNAAIASVGGGTGIEGFGKVTIPPGSYTFSTTISLAGYPNVLLDCEGANLTYAGTTIAVDALQPSGTNASGGIQNCNIYSPSRASSNVVAFRMGNAVNYRFQHNSAWNFNASGDVGLLVENTTYFTEDSLIADNQMRQVTIGFEFLKNCSVASCTNSAEYTFFRGNHWNSPYNTVSGATGLLISGGIALQNSLVELHANVNGPSGGTVVALRTPNDQILRDQIAIQAEPDGITGNSAVCVSNAGGFFANGTLLCDGMSNSGKPVVVFGSDGGSIGDEGSYTASSTILAGATTGTSNNVLPDSEDIFGSAYWQPPAGSFRIGSSPANTGHTDFGYWNTGATMTCTSGSLHSQTFNLPPGTYTISAEQVIGGGATPRGCSGSYMNLALFVNGIETANLYGNKNPNAPVTFTLHAPSTVFLSFQYNQWTFPLNSYAVWYAPQIEPGHTMTAYKQSLWGISPQRIVQVGTPKAGQAACIKSAGPPVTLGSCSTQPTSTGSCVCN